MTAYTGRVAFVDLTSRSIKKESLPEKVYRDFIGGTGIGAKVLYERMKPNVDPLGAENILGFVSGLLSGTGTPMATKFLVVAKSPLSSMWGEANSGGSFGQEIKAAGYDAIFLTGVASQPVYLLVDNDDIVLRSAGKIWGKATRETVETLVSETGYRKLRVACIGPSGESRSLIASIMTDDGRAAARSGVGAVMGSKNLKAVAIRGSSRLVPANSGELSRIRSQTLCHLRDVDRLPFVKQLRETGTCSGVLRLVPAGGAPIKNWSLIGEDAFPEYTKIGGTNITKYQLRKSGCGMCPINCGGVVRVEEGPFATEARKPEYETLAAFGTMLLNSNAESIIKANEICDLYGVDTISAGSAIAFAMECYEKGIIGKAETGGIDLQWGNPSAILAMLGKMVRREGLGDVLADGVKRAAERIGKGAEEFAVHVHGQEPGFHDPRLHRLRGLGLIGHPTPGRHMAPFASIRMEGEGTLANMYPELQRPEADDGVAQEGKIHALAVSYQQAFVNCGICLFALSSGTDFPLVDFIRAATGWDFTVADAIDAGKRSLSLQQAFNIREGVNPESVILPSRIGNPPTMGPFAGTKIDFDALRRSYYKAMGWDADTGKPSEQRICEG
jgi:aldehyde:ferredoxin oxidoreductase